MDIDKSNEIEWWCNNHGYGGQNEYSLRWLMKKPLGNMS